MLNPTTAARNLYAQIVRMSKTTLQRPTITGPKILEVTGGIYKESLLQEINTYGKLQKPANRVWLGKFEQFNSRESGKDF